MPRRTTHIAPACPTATNACGRLLRVDDGTGYQIFSYDKLGNVSENIRTFALPFEDSVYNFRMMFEYDTWNRVQRIVYPDSEVVTYNYDLAGNLCRVHTYKANHRDTLIKNILYDEFGHRTQVVFGNGVTTNYTYDILQRLNTLQTYSNNASLQKILYSFDLEDNITRIENTASGANGLGEGYFTTENPSDDETPLKRGIGSQRKAKVLVMVESEAVDEPKKGKKNRKCGHIKMKVIRDLKSSTFESEASKSIDTKATVIMDNLGSHAGVEKVVSVSERQTVPGKEAPKVLPWVHVAISNAKALMKDMYHGIKEEFLQSYLDEFCYKFNRMYFGDRTFDRLVVAAVAYKPTFKHRPYNSSPLCG